MSRSRYALSPEQKQIAQEYFKSLAGQPYRPANGTEGDIFQAEWCDRCAKDWISAPGSVMNHCNLVALSMAYDLTDPEYPKEWVRDENGYPKCTAFEEREGGHV